MYGMDFLVQEENSKLIITNLQDEPLSKRK